VTARRTPSAPTGDASDAPAERLQKVLAAAGVASRRACEELIAAGRVTIDGRVATLGDKVDAARAEVRIDGERVQVRPGLVYLVLNKPQGVVTTATDPQGRPTVLDLVRVRERVFPVGRLDIDTEGLLLLTNDGALAHALTHPSFEVPKVYVARVRGKVKRAAVKALLAGVELDDGPARARQVRVLGEDADRSLIELVMTEGRKREVRRLLDAVGLPVERLARTAVDGVELGDLRQGRWRHLQHAEVVSLLRATDATPSSGRRHPPRRAQKGPNEATRGAVAVDRSTTRSNDKSTGRQGPARRRAR